MTDSATTRESKNMIFYIALPLVIVTSHIYLSLRTSSVEKELVRKEHFEQSKAHYSTEGTLVKITGEACRLIAPRE